MSPSPELLERCCRNDRKAHYELYEMCFSFLLAVCRRYYINREDKVSAINQVYVKMIRDMKTYLKKKQNIPFELWMRRIAINHITDEYRKNKKHQDTLDFSEIQETATHPSMIYLSDTDRMEEIQEAIRNLSDMNRTVFNLFVVDGYDHEEIGKMLNISSGTSKTHLHRARKKLKEILDNGQKKKHLIHNVLIQ